MEAPLVGQAQGLVARSSSVETGCTGGHGTAVLTMHRLGGTPLVTSMLATPFKQQDGSGTSTARALGS